MLSADLITGTISPSSPSEVAMPILMAPCTTIPSSVQVELTLGKALKAAAMAEMR